MKYVTKNGLIMEGSVDGPVRCACPREGGPEFAELVTDLLNEHEAKKGTGIAESIAETTIRRGQMVVLNEVFVVFGGPPENESGRFVEVETADGKSVCAGSWEEKNGLWYLGPLYVSAMPAVMKKLWQWFLVFYHLSDSAVCEMSKGRGPHDDYHDYQDGDGIPVHFKACNCKRCGKEFFI